MWTTLKNEPILGSSILILCFVVNRLFGDIFTAALVKCLAKFGFKGTALIEWLAVNLGFLCFAVLCILVAYRLGKSKPKKLEVIKAYVQKMITRGSNILSLGQGIESSRGQTNTPNDAYEEMKKLNIRRDAALERYRRWRQEISTVFGQAILNGEFRLKPLPDKSTPAQLIHQEMKPWADLEYDLGQMKRIFGDLKTPHLNSTYDFSLLSDDDS